MWQQWPDGKLRVVFCDVGQGDASLVVWGSFQALVDTGPSEQKLFACLGREMPFWDREIDLVFISHPQKDHNGALKGLLSRYRVGKVIEKASKNDLYRYKDLYFDILLAGDSETGVLGTTSNDENEASMILLVKRGDVSVLFTGDIGEKTETILVEEGKVNKVTVLKVSHHGSKYSSSKSFLETVLPMVAVVSVGAKNSYGHPSADALTRLEEVGAKVLRTDLQGSVEIRFDEGVKVFADR